MNYCTSLKYSAEVELPDGTAAHPDCVSYGKYAYVPENGYLTVPDLPGCMADGESPNEAYENVKIVMREWMETAQADGRPIQEPVFGRDKF